MAARYDVASRLAEGAAAVEEVTAYVWAARLRGYHHPDLTLHAQQAGDWYRCSDGLNLGALEGDSATLRSLAETGAAAVTVTDEQRSALSAAWSGAGAQTSEAFLVRHRAAAQSVVDRLSAAAGVYQRLREQLWLAVDAMVAGVTAVADRPGAQRADWLAAARAVVLGGAGEQAEATVDAAVTPFVTGVVAVDWLAAVRSCQAEVSEAYRAAEAELSAGGPIPFEVPGELVPPSPRTANPTPTPIQPAATQPAATQPAPMTPAAEPAGATPAATASAPAASAEPLGYPAAEDWLPSDSELLSGTTPSASQSPIDSGLGALPAATDAGLGSSPGLGSLPQFSLPEFALPDLGDPLPDDEGLFGEEPEQDAPEHDETEESDDANEDDGEGDGEEANTDAAADAQTDPADPNPAEDTTPAPAAELATPPPASETDPAATPCEIAADALPQVGE